MEKEAFEEAEKVRRAKEEEVRIDNSFKFHHFYFPSLFPVKLGSHWALLKFEKASCNMIECLCQPVFNSYVLQILGWNIDGKSLATKF